MVSNPGGAIFFGAPGPSENASNGRNRSAVDHVLAPMNGRRSLGSEEGDQFGDFLGAAGATDRDTAQRSHQALPRRALVGSGLLGQPDDQSMRGVGFDEPGRDR